MELPWRIRRKHGRGLSDVLLEICHDGCRGEKTEGRIPPGCLRHDQTADFWEVGAPWRIGGDDEIWASQWKARAATSGGGGLVVEVPSPWYKSWLPHNTGLSVSGMAHARNSLQQSCPLSQPSWLPFYLGHWIKTFSQHCVVVERTRFSSQNCRQILAVALHRSPQSTHWP